MKICGIMLASALLLCGCASPWTRKPDVCAAGEPVVAPESVCTNTAANVQGSSFGSEAYIWDDWKEK